jgi:hypothetical protein
LNPRPLGYEPYDVCLWCLKQSLIAVLTSADQRHEVVPVLLRLPRLSMSRHVSCTNACTNQPLGLPVRVVSMTAQPGAQAREHQIRRLSLDPPIN